MAIRITRAGVALTVGIILVAGLIIGGFFLVRNLGEQARRDEATQLAEQTLEEQANEEVALNEGDTQNEQQEQQATPPQASGNGSTQNQAGEGSANSAAPANQLPETGPADVSAIIIVGLISFTGLSYYQSRRVLQQK